MQQEYGIIHSTGKTVHTMKKQFTTIRKKKKIRITGADAVMRSLASEGVDTIFGYPGGAIMPIYDALMDHSDKTRHILTRHEQGAIHAAQGYARVSGKVGVHGHRDLVPQT
jgi:TPP-dependent trihydroxycyclohexane-1,2-dione (THcHDO) dehydratase